MDKSLYIAMTGASATLRGQAAVAHNLANADTTGFQATLSGTVAAPVQGPGHASRVAAVQRTLGVSEAPGARTVTGNPLDIALEPGHWLAVQAADGGVAAPALPDRQRPADHRQRLGARPRRADSAAANDAIEIGGDGTISVVRRASRCRRWPCSASCRSRRPPPMVLARTG